MEEMFQAGSHYGYSKTRRHPAVSPYIYATKNKLDIINLEKTSLMLEKACGFVRELGSRNQTILLIGTKPEAKEAVKKAAESLNLPYVSERWIGGTLSNFAEIKKRILELENYRRENKEGGLEKYTKKERGILAKKMEKLARYYSGLINLKKLPEALFLIDAKAENIARMEANNLGIPVIALLNSDSDIEKIDYPIVGNDVGIPSIKLFSEAIAKAYKNGQSSAPQN